jgi:hypothetical protein
MSDAEISATPSTSENPDLDWSQVRETVLMLDLAIAQISSTLVDGDESVSTLADSFTSMVGNAEMIKLAADNLPDSGEKDTIMQNCQAVSAEMNKAIVAFQFYDSMTQRLEHVSKSLEVLGQLVTDPAQLYNPYAWRGLQEKIKSKYTVESERLMFEAIRNGQSVEEALKIAKQSAEANSGEAELF